MQKGLPGERESNWFQRPSSFLTQSLFIDSPFVDCAIEPAVDESSNGIAKF